MTGKQMDERTLRKKKGIQMLRYIRRYLVVSGWEKGNSDHYWKDPNPDLAGTAVNFQEDFDALKIQLDRDLPRKD